MKGFIKVADTNGTEHYLNISHIIKFIPSNPHLSGNTIITTTSGTVQTSTTPDEIVDMINLSNE